MARHQSAPLDPRTLEERFFDFLGQLDGSESIDHGISAHELGKSKRADYLLRNRDIIVEVKTLTDDPEYKIEERLKSHRNRPEFPAFYWPCELSEILPYLPDGEEIRRKIFHAITNAVQRAVRSADDQIAETKKALKLPNACGVLVLLNEDIGILSPEIVTAKVNQLILQKRDEDFRFKHIAYIWIISEGHLVQFKNSPETLPLVLLEGPYADSFKEKGDYLDSLLSRWSEFSGVPLFHLGRIENFNGLKFDKRDQPTPQPKQDGLSRHEIWRLTYRKAPYLRHLAETDFLIHTGRVLSSLAPHFIKGREKLPHEKVIELMIAWTHTLEEAEFRRLDMRKVREHIRY